MKFFIIIDARTSPIFHNHQMQALVYQPLWAACQFFDQMANELLTSVTCVDGTRFAMERVRLSSKF